jgi:hypothetical protein
LTPICTFTKAYSFLVFNIFLDVSRFDYVILNILYDLNKEKAYPPILDAIFEIVISYIGNFKVNIVHPE